MKIECSSQEDTNVIDATQIIQKKKSRVRTVKISKNALSIFPEDYFKDILEKEKTLIIPSHLLIDWVQVINLCDNTNFTSLLFKLIFKADNENFLKLVKVYPLEVFLVKIYRLGFINSDFFEVVEKSNFCDLEIEFV